MLPRTVCIGYDSREQAAYAVAQHTVREFTSKDVRIIPLVLDDLIKEGLYTRPIEYLENGQMWDPISGASMSTEFAISRFLAPILATKGIHPTHNGGYGWVLFMDCDVLIRKPLAPLFDIVQRYPNKALFCVHHEHEPPPGKKMDGQEQLRYKRKNWSSVMLINCDHPANRVLTAKYVNSLPGRDLHRFCWLMDEEIGSLDVRWNWLVGHSPPNVDPTIVHFTEGGPWFKEYKNVPYADEWLSKLLFG